MTLAERKRLHSRLPMQSTELLNFAIDVHSEV